MIRRWFFLFVMGAVTGGAGRIALAGSVLGAGKLSAKAEAIQAAIESKATEVDTDGDGKVDMWRKYGTDGALESLSYDNNGDGRPDEWVRFTRDGNYRERARSFDGKVDERETQRREGMKVLSRTREILVQGVWKLSESWEVQAGGKVAKVVHYDSTGAKTFEGFEPLEVR